MTHFAIADDFLQAQNANRQPALEEDYGALARALGRRGVDSEILTKKVMGFGVAIPTWGVGTGGTRFARFPGVGEPRHLHDKLDDCATQAGAICGQVVWVKDLSSTSNDCGVRIMQLDRYEKDAWRDGWVYDPRDHKKYKGVVRVKEGHLNVRAFVGTEILGQTEQFERIDTLPPTPVCKL